MLALACRCWLLLSVALGAVGTPWWAMAAGVEGSTRSTETALGSAALPNATDATDATSKAAKSAHDCHDTAAPPADPAGTPAGPAADGHLHGSDCAGALCDCGCVLPPLLMPALLTLPAGALPPAPRFATRAAPHAPALNTPFRPPIG